MSNDYSHHLRIVLVALLISKFGYALADDGVFYSDDKLTTPISTRITNSPTDNAKTITAGDQIKVWVNGCTYSNVRFDETERHSRIANDFNALLGNLKGRATLLESCGPKLYEYPLRYDRAQLKLTAIDLTGKEASTVTIVTGPKEHLYLGLDLPINSSETLKYDATTKSLVPADTNPQLYLSFNYYFGDLANPNESKSKFSLKAMVLATSRPLDSIGLGIGYQLPKLNALGLDLTPLSAFVGRFWNKQDALAADGVGLANQSTTSSWRVGISFDLGTALGWVK